MGKATKGTLTIKHLLLIFCFLSLIQVSLSYNTDSSKYSLFCFNSCKRRSIFKEKNETNKVLTFIIIIIIIIIIIYLFSHDLGIRRKILKRRQLLAIFVKLNFSVYWYLFKPQNLPSATYLTDNPFSPTTHLSGSSPEWVPNLFCHSITIRFLGLIGRELLSMLSSCLWSIREQT